MLYENAYSESTTATFALMYHLCKSVSKDKLLLFCKLSLDYLQQIYCSPTRPSCLNLFLLKQVSVRQTGKHAKWIKIQSFEKVKDFVKRLCQKSKLLPKRRCPYLKSLDASNKHKVQNFCC